MRLLLKFGASEGLRNAQILAGQEWVVGRTRLCGGETDAPEILHTLITFEELDAVAPAAVDGADECNNACGKLKAPLIAY